MRETVNQDQNKSQSRRYTGLIERYRDRLPVSASTPIISLGEGNTPLIRLNNIPRKLGADVELYVKFEGLNPTGSFKDRAMTMAVTKAVEDGSKAIICASTGIRRQLQQPMPHVQALLPLCSSPTARLPWAN